MTDPAVAFTCNGTAVSVRADHPHLLAALREELDITSPKDGCSPSGQCGCCTVLIDGKASRQLPDSRWTKVAGKSVITLEGRRRRRARAATPTPSPPCGGLQCGFCTPGIIVRAKALVDKKGADLTARTWPATSAPTCAGARAT